MLGKRGHEVVIVSSGSAAIVLLEQDRAFDLVLMDLQMPGMSGFEATEIIREQEGAQNLAPLRIVALTGNALAGDREACLAAGMDDYLAKPFRSAELVALVEPEQQEVVVEAVVADDVKPDKPETTRALLLEGVEGDDALLRELVDMVFGARLR